MTKLDKRRIRRKGNNLLKKQFFLKEDYMTKLSVVGKSTS